MDTFRAVNVLRYQEDRYRHPSCNTINAFLENVVLNKNALTEGVTPSASRGSKNSMQSSYASHYIDDLLQPHRVDEFSISKRH